MTEFWLNPNINLSVSLPHSCCILWNVQECNVSWGISSSFGFGETGPGLMYRWGNEKRFNRQAKWLLSFLKENVLINFLVLFSPKLWCAKKVMMIKMLKRYHSCFFSVNDSLDLSQSIMRLNDCASHAVLLSVEIGLQGDMFCFPSFIFSSKCKPLLNLRTVVDCFLWRIVRS